MYIIYTIAKSVVGWTGSPKNKHVNAQEATDVQI